MRLDGEKVYLTPITYDDCEDYVRWRNSESISSYFIYRQKLTEDDQINWIKKSVKTGKVVQFIIWDKIDCKKIGSVYLQKIDNVRHESEFGIFIGESDYINGGRGTEAAKLITTYAFNNLSMLRIYLRVLLCNGRAQHSYEKAGFTLIEDYKETIHINGDDVDVVFMEMRKAE